MGILDRLIGRDSAPPAAAPHPVDSDVSPLTAYDSVQSSLTGLGDSGRDIGAALQVRPRQWMSDVVLDLWYEQSVYAGALVDLLPREAFRSGFSIRRGDEPDVCATVDRKYGVTHHLEHLDKQARLYGAALLVAVPERGNVALPRRPSARTLRLEVYGWPEWSVQRWGSDYRGERYRLPETYSISPVVGSAMTVHWSHVVYLGGFPISERRRYERSGRDLPVLERYYDALTQREGLDASAAGLAQRASVSILRIAGYVEKMAQGRAQRDAIKARIAAFSRSLSSVGVGLLDDQDAYERHALSAGGWGELDATARRAISAVESIPQAAWFGDTPGGLSSDDSMVRRQLQRAVSSHQRYLTPVVERTFSLCDPEWEGDEVVVWSPLDEPTATERADVRLKNAQAAATIAPLAGLSVEEVRRGMDGDDADFVPVLDEDGADVESVLAAMTEPIEDDEPTAGDPDVTEAGAADAETYQPPESARNNARKVLRWRDEHGDEVAGMTEVGWRRARQLASGDPVSRETVAAMSSFNRHRANAEVAEEHKDTPWRDAGYVAWLGWGGTTGIEWARGITGADD